MKILTRFPLTGNNKEAFLFSELPFLPENDKWEYTDSFDEAEIILEISDCLNRLDQLKTKVIDRMRGNQILLILGIWHSDNTVFCEPQLKLIYSDLKKLGCDQIIFVHTNEQLLSNEFASVDLMWNRQKLYFTEYQKYKNLDKRVWTEGCTENVYKLNDISFDSVRSKTILSPSRIYGSPIWPKHIRMDQRKKLRDLLLENNVNGYINRSEENNIFLPNETTPTLLDKIKGPGTWYPIADSYYNDSYVSVYVETITLNRGNQCTTEKSFDPLIKGHFILPMGNYGYIRLLKEKYGFRFPSWLDYSYDSVINDKERFETYLESVKKLIDIPIFELHSLCKNDIEILEHNRSVFFKRHYSSLYDSIKNCIEYRKLKI
jgi:hypothetical protein